MSLPQPQHCQSSNCVTLSVKDRKSDGKIPVSTELTPLFKALSKHTRFRGLCACSCCFQCFITVVSCLPSILWSWIKALNFRDVLVSTFEEKPHQISSKHLSKFKIWISVLSGIKNPLRTRTFNLMVFPFWTPCDSNRCEKGEPSFSRKCLIILSFLLLPSWGPNGPAATLSLTNHPFLPNWLSWTQRCSSFCSELWLTWTKNDSLVTFNLVTFARAVKKKKKKMTAVMSYNLW